jgi:hypothetical protein
MMILLAVNSVPGEPKAGWSFIDPNVTVKSALATPMIGSARAN